MKFLVRGKEGFLEAELKEGDLIPTNIKVHPKDLFHFGTDVVEICSHDKNRFIPDSAYLNKMKKACVNYLFVSQQSEDVDYAQSGKRLIAATAYMKK